LLVSFLNSRSNASNSSLYLRRPAIRAPNVCCSWYCRTSKVGQVMELHSCHFHIGSDLAKLFFCVTDTV
jgi:hypothetical protein